MISATVAVVVGTLVLLLVWSAGERVGKQSHTRLRPVSRAFLALVLAVSLAALQRFLGIGTLLGALAVPLIPITAGLMEVLWARSLEPIRRPGVTALALALFACSLTVYATAALVP